MPISIPNESKYNTHLYDYSGFYQRIETKDDTNLSIPHILCPVCFNDTFSLQYGNYEINAICKCGHSMTVYEG